MVKLKKRRALVFFKNLPLSSTLALCADRGIYMTLVHTSVHAMKTIDGHDVRYARLGYLTARGHIGQSPPLNLLSAELRAVAELGELATPGKRAP